ncbi:type I restriction endonuclease [Dysgonomonas sp. ZJ709]|uniref:type I restriction endonuclease n=1 Tax=Dysgonomonas sp. ZJ709 TaxID=2709797 RepID=UPI0013EA75B2|nr:type I restriction endonuclease [Dysgonomonas sp. ZJ709]
MDFRDQINQLSNRVDKLKENLQTEEATKNALIMPFLQSMGYDVFNPLEVMPEFTCDIGTKKGEKIDYAVFKDGDPIILVECKHWKQDLTLHDNQLLRYFHVSKAKFGLLTNGIMYKFYTDLETPNKMDEKPFLEINLLDIKNNQVEELKKFHKAYFDVENILSSANELKYTSELKSIINKEFSNPSPEFVKLFAKQVYEGVITNKLLDQFTTLVRKSVSGLISDIISDRLKTALKTETSKVEEVTEQETETEIIDNKGVITTEEEKEGFMIIKAILREVVDVSRVAYRDAQSYFAVLFDDNNRKPICRLYFNGSKKYIVTFDENKKETRHDIESLDDIYNYQTELKNIAIYYTNS